MEERDDKQSVDVTFHPPSDGPPPDPDHPDYTVVPHPAPGEDTGDADPEGPAAAHGA
jgi:hypothetical protein